MEGGIQLLNQDDHTDGKAEPNKKARQEQLAAIRLCRPLSWQPRFYESELLAFLTLLQVLGQFGLLLPLQQGLIEPLCRIVVALQAFHFLIPPWCVFNTLLVERDGTQ